MGKGGVIAALVILFFLFTFFVPIFPYNISSASYFGIADGSVSADVSLSYLIFSCGSYNDLHYTGNFLGNSVNIPASKSGYSFKCG